MNIAVDKNGLIWLGVRGEGIFSYDGNSFKKYEIENNIKTDIYVRTNKNGSVFFSTPSEEQYYFNGQKFLKQTVLKENVISVPFGYEVLKVSGAYESVYVPIGLNRSVVKKLDDGTLVLTTRDNLIYFAEESDNNFFEDLSLVFKVEGHKNSISTGAAFVYFDENHTPDILVYNSGAGKYPELYLNKSNRPFVEASWKIAPVFSKRSVLFEAGDLNGDLRSDLVVAEFGTEGNIVKTYFQKPDGNFSIGKAIPALKDYNSKPFKNLRLIDFDKNGKLDIDISTFFGKEMKRGNQLLLMNKGLSGPSEYDKSFSRLTGGWTTQSIFADFNGDGENDWLLIKEWEAPKLLIKSDENFSVSSLPINDSSATLGALAFDYDNDGDLDLLTTSDEKILSVFNNDSKGAFSNVTERLKLKQFNLKTNNSKINRSLTCGDFNNDGFLDFFISYAEPGNKRNYLFINDSSKAFVEKSEKYSVAYPYVEGSITGDIDGDGDIDLYGFKEGFNKLWVNNLNDENYLAIIPRGIKSNYDALGAKVSLFSAGKNMDENALIGYRQIGSEQFGVNQICQRLAHFGVTAKSLYDVKIEFYGGETKVLTNVKPGQTIEIFEMSGLSAALYLLPGKILRFVRSTENQLYILVVIIAFFILIFGVKLGVKRYRWLSATTTAIILVNISIFWLMIFLSLNSDSYLTKYVLPIVVMAFGLFLPHFIFFTITKNPFSNKTKKEVEENLLRKLMLFTHGEWALRNLSGLQLLMQNVPAEKENLPNYFELLEKRRKTFFEMTLPLITEISEALNYLGEERKTASSLLKEIKTIQTALEKNNLTVSNAEELKSVWISFSYIKEALKKVKEKVFRKFSCDPVDVVKNIANEYASVAEKEHVELKKYRDYDSEAKALITAADLGIVLENCLQNSFRAVAGKENPAIQIIVKRNAPKILIEVTDNGTGIDKSIADKIFEQGFSASGSTGSGLHISKTILEKYNGRIFIKETEPEIGTTIVIELNEGM